MSKAQVMPFVLLAVWMLGGCGSPDSSDRIAKLQEQVGKVVQQLDETKKQVDGLQEANQRSIRALEDLSATVERLSAGSAASPVGKVAAGVNSKTEARSQTALQSQGKAREVFTVTTNSAIPSIRGEKDSVSPRGDDDLRADARQAALGKEPSATMVAMSCSQVWRQIGQGKTPESAARALGVSIAVIHACEKKVGRNSASR